MAGSRLFPDKSFLVIAHRGASCEAPENTFAAFETALAMRADMIELDVQLSADGIPVVFHDEWLEDHTDGSGSILELTFSDIKKLDAGSWFSDPFRGEKIPSLEEVLEWAKGRILLNVEIKAESVRKVTAGSVVDEVVRLIVAYGMQDQVLISSFHYKALERVRESGAGIKTGVLYNKEIPGRKNPAELVAELGASAFHCSREQITGNRAQLLRAANIPFLIYTVNRASEMENLIQKGAAGIFTDKPDVLRDVSDRFHQPGKVSGK